MTEEYDIKDMKIVLSSQTYGPVNPVTNKYLRVAIMYAANRGMLWAGDASVDRYSYGKARNVATQYALNEQPDADGIMWVDSDIKPQPHQIAQLLHKVRHAKLDFLTGVYFQREGVHNPVFHAWNEDMQTFQPAEAYPPNTLGKADGCGFGFVFTSLKLMRDVAFSKNFEPETGWFPDRRDAGGSGEDLSFCLMAKDAGHQLYVDTGIIVEHEGQTQYICEADFEKEREAWIRQNKKPPKVEWGPVNKT